MLKLPERDRVVHGEAILQGVGINLIASVCGSGRGVEHVKYRLMDLLACPYDKAFPLKLYVLETRKYAERTVTYKRKPACELYCAFRDKRVEELQGDPGCDECIKYEVAEGVLQCQQCGRWYPIMDEIPIMLPDEMRKKEEDLDFLAKYKDKLPKELVEEGKPWNLKEEGQS